jgi:hypothetical protein
MWNPHGFHVIDRLPTGTKMNSTYFVSNILHPLRQIFFSGERHPRAKRLVIHVDNCTVHRSLITESCMEKSDMISMPHPPYSPDLAPSDFFLFGAVKEKLEHLRITDVEQLFEEVDTILKSYSGEELNNVFEAWLERVRNVSEGDGGYID